MEKIYILHHYDPEADYDPEVDDGRDIEKMIGVYSSEERVRQAIERLRDKPGFRDCPDRCWLIEDIVVDKENAWENGFVTFINGIEQEEGSQ